MFRSPSLSLPDLEKVLQGQADPSGAFSLFFHPHRKLKMSQTSLLLLGRGQDWVAEPPKHTSVLPRHRCETQTGALQRGHSSKAATNAASPSAGGRNLGANLLQDTEEFLVSGLQK